MPRQPDKRFLWQSVATSGADSATIPRVTFYDRLRVSLIRLSRAHSHLPAWLGLFAMLLLFIAPVISKSLEHSRGSAMPMMMHHGGMMSAEMPSAASEQMDDMDEMSHHHSMTMDTMPHHDGMQHATSPAKSAKPAKFHSMSMMDDSACGYCVLLIHLPLHLNHLPELWTLLQAAAPPVAAPEPLFTAVFVPIHFRPRAPPLLTTIA